MKKLPEIRPELGREESVAGAAPASDLQAVTAGAFVAAGAFGWAVNDRSPRAASRSPIVAYFLGAPQSR